MKQPQEGGRTPTKAWAPTRSRTMRILNLRLLIETLVVAAVIGPAIYLWYRYQLNRTAGAMLERAETLADKDDSAAARYYFQYLRLKPGDAQAQVQLAETFDRAAQGGPGKAQAVEYYYEALGVAPADKQPALRQRLGDLLLELDRFVPAEEEAQEILKREADDPQGNRLLALALYGQSRRGSLGGDKQAASLGRAAVRAHQLNPGDPDVAVMLADLYRHQPQWLEAKEQALPAADREKLADRVMEQMIAAKPKDAKTRLAHYHYQLRYHRAAAEADLEAALKENPDNLDVALEVALEAEQKAESARRTAPAEQQVHLERARKQYERAAEISPKDERAYVGLADLYVRLSEPKLAIATLRKGLKRAGNESINLNARLADVLVGQGQLDEADKILTALERTAERIAPLQPQPAKLALKRLLDSLRGHWLVAKRRYLDAITTLRRVAVGQQTTPQEIARSMQSWLWLAGAYSALGQWDQAAIAAEQAALLEPKMVTPHLEAAAAWAAADRPDAAEQHYRQALAISPSNETWLNLARILLQQQVRLPKGARNWDAFQKALAEAKKLDAAKPLSDPWRLKLLEADYLIGRAEEPGQGEGSTRDALALCRQLEQENPNVVGLLGPLAATYQRLNQPADADRLVKRLESMKGQEAAACVLKARFCVLRKQYDEARKVLTAALETAPAELRSALRRELMQTTAQQGRTDEAAQQLRKLYADEPTNLALLAQLTEVEFDAGKLAEVRQREEELRKLEGDNGLFWRYYRARRLLAEASGPNDPKLVEASKLQAVVQTQRPAWARAHLLQGLLLEARGIPDQAADAYRETIRLGERSPLPYQRLISLLMQTNQLDEADRYLSLMQSQAAPSDDLASLESLLAARRGQTDRALESARRGVAQRPKDALAQLWLGQVLLTLDKNAEAEAALKKAVELAPSDARTLGGLIGFYVRTKCPAEARQVLDKVSKDEKLDKAQRDAILAQGYELLGDMQQAGVSHRNAARRDPNDDDAQVRLAAYLLRSGKSDDRSEAEQLLRSVLGKSPDFAPARRLLAGLLADRGGQRAWQEARDLIEEKGAAGTNVDRRLEAMLLARRSGRENLEKSRRILEELVADPRKAIDADRRLLARLYESGGNVDAALQQYSKLVSRDKVDRADLAAYIEMLLRHDRLDEAETWLNKWEAGRPAELDSAAVRARWLKGKGQAVKIEPLIEPLAEKAVNALPKDSPESEKILLSLGNLYASLDQPQAAERWYRRLAAIRRGLLPQLVDCLARRGQMKEAIEMCAEAAKTDDSPLPATTTALALLAGKATAADLAVAEPLLNGAVARHKDNVNLLSAVAGLRVVQNRLDDAIALYRQILVLKPDDVSALNNLATLLSERPEHRQEALRCIDQAIEIVGPQPGLLDTKGMILVFENKPQEAVTVLEQAAASPLTDPRYHFHLAVAYDRAGQGAKAKAALKIAREHRLEEQILTPTDAKTLLELKKKFD